ncbi:DNA cytosine methyltransferase [Azospirillum argentinense]|uniref:Uncharacterized protein n=1 Tax=Azospirillum argentinense TaxID=2970906 RepID=A0A5B0KZN6_9PROT|nr:DNA cytosine methyltransferase [Azospirillum argentinense]KAA1057173.1 DNA-cytosine methyltransferase [Azospirillum argentinense]
MAAYYNEFDPGAAAWLRELIAEGHIALGDVDTRSIADVQPDDLKGYTQAHFFAGIGGWSLALRLGGWPDDRPVWTGSCPCQPFSAAGKRRGVSDERHLWPEFRRLIAKGNPKTVFGEQVSSAEVIGTQLEADFALAVRKGDFARANKLAKRLVKSKTFHFDPRWIDAVCGDLESLGYAVRTEILGAHSVGAPHIRQRLWWVADADTNRRAAPPVAGVQHLQHHAEPRRGACLALAHSGGPRLEVVGEQHARAERPAAERGGAPSGVGLADRAGWDEGRPAAEAARHRGAAGPAGGDGAGGVANAGRECHERWRGPGEASGAGCGAEGEAQQRQRSGAAAGDHGAARHPWSSVDWLPCRDGKARPVEPGTFPLAHGVPGRVGLLRGYGNAINPWVAAEFIGAFLDVEAGVSLDLPEPANQSRYLDRTA